MNGWMRLCAPRDRPQSKAHEPDSSRYCENIDGKNVKKKTLKELTASGGKAEALNNWILRWMEARMAVWMDGWPDGWMDG